MRSLSIFLFLSFLRESVSKQEMACCTLEAEPYVMRSDVRVKNGYDGVSIEYFARLQERTGLKCASMKNVQVPGSVGWSEFIYKMANCSRKILKDHPICSCDVGVGAWYEHPDRTGVDFLPSHIYDGFMVLTHVDNTFASMDGAFFLKAFSPLIWLSILALVICFAFLKMLDKRFAPPKGLTDPPGKQKPYQRLKYYILKGRTLYRLRRALQSACGEILKQPSKAVEGNDGSTRQWVLNFTIGLCGIFLGLVYEASMTASLVQEETQSLFGSVADFKYCNIHDSDVCFVKGDIIQTYWNTYIARQPCRKNGKNGTPRVIEKYDLLISATANKECKYTLVDGGTALSNTYGRYCGKLVTVGEIFNKDGLGAVLPKGSSLKEKLSRATLELRQQEALDDTMLKYFSRTTKCEILTPPQLDFRKLRIFFILSFSACALIFFEMVLDPQSPTAQEKEIGESKAVDNSSDESDGRSDDEVL